MEEIGFVNNK